MRIRSVASRSAPVVLQRPCGDRDVDTRAYAGCMLLRVVAKQPELSGESSGTNQVARTRSFAQPLIQIEIPSPQPCHHASSSHSGVCIMTIEHHALINEFPQFKSLIHDLKLSNNHFAKLFDEYHVVDREIVRVEQGIEPRSDVDLENLKKNRIQLKDQLYRLLQAAN